MEELGNKKGELIYVKLIKLLHKSVEKKLQILAMTNSLQVVVRTTQLLKCPLWL